MPRSTLENSKSGAAGRQHRYALCYLICALLGLIKDFVHQILVKDLVDLMAFLADNLRHYGELGMA
jgi:hypothetical protein